ncbi:MAG TPA: hypothetical protein VGE76_13970, partial [Opitutaceae bacterium]
PSDRQGKVEPLLATGSYGQADLLGVHYLSETTGEFVYDSWGAGRTRSQPFPLAPGTAHALGIEMPSLAAVEKDGDDGLVRVVLDGREVMSARCHYYRRDAADVFFTLNPVVRATGGSYFAVRLETLDGRVLRGGPRSYFSWSQRFGSLFREQAILVAFAATLSLLLGLMIHRGWLESKPRTAPALHAARTRPPHRAFAVTLALCGVVFSHLMTSGRFDFFAEDLFGHFYDHQAQSLLAGKLDVPAHALDNEAFIHKGKVYGYFGPTPAILRLPFAAAGIGFGRLTRVVMLASYLAALGAAYTMLCRATRLNHGAGAWPSAWAAGMLVGTLGLGSTLLFLSSRAYVYHEAILCGAAFALWGGYWTLRYLESGRSRDWLVALVLGIAAIHARAPLGLFALTFVAATACVRALPELRTRRLRAIGPPLLIGASAAAGIFSFNALSYAKFETFEGCPLRLNLQYHADRLARIDGKQFHVANIPFGANAYLFAPSLVIDSHFPFFHTAPAPLANYPDAKIDLTEATVSLPWCMPALCVLALCSWAVTGGPARQARLAAWLAVVPMAGALFAAIAISQRYTADFIPFLAVAAALGMAAVDASAASAYRVLRGALVAFVLFSTAVTVALALHYQGETVWGVPDEIKQEYRTLRDTVDRLLHGPE